MSAFVNQLRARAATILVGAPDAPGRITIRVQMSDVWDMVRVTAPASTPVDEVKRLALAELLPEAQHADVVVKLNGFEVLDELASLEETGVKEGSTLLVAYRRRRPVR